MGRLFGTDGVRGLAGVNSAPAGTGPLGGGRAGPRSRRHPPAAGRGGRPRPPHLRRVPGGGRGRRPGQLRGGRAPPRRAAHAGGGLSGQGPGRRLRRGPLGQPQPGQGQRDQVLRPRRPQAAGRGRGRDRGAAGRAAGPPSPHGFGRVIEAEREQEKYLDHLVASLGATGAGPAAAGGPAGGGRLRPRRGLRHRARGPAPGRGRDHRDRGRARRRQHQLRLRLHPPGHDRVRGPVQAPTSASRTTATPTAAWPWTPPGRWSTGTRSWPCWRPS